MAQTNRRTRARTIAFTSFAVAALVTARTAEAAIGFKAGDGWEVSFDGFVNGFAANERGSEVPSGVQADPLMSTDKNTFRLRTGLLPGLFAFNVKAPKVDGLDIKARVGLYPQINNANTRDAFGSQLDVRELFFTVDSPYGQVLLGRALNLFQGKNILTDMTLFGVGTQGAVSSGGTTLGRIGYGYLYAQFGAQARYTTPSFSGVKLAVSVVDPSQIAGGGVAASITKAPGLESEISYSGKISDVAVQAWLSGLYQSAWIPATATTTNERKTAAGGAAGVSVALKGFEVLGSGFIGKGLGSFLLLDVDGLDPAGHERRSAGVLAQASYTILGKTKIGLSYGQNSMRETATEEELRLAGEPAALSTRSSWTGGIYHDINKNLKAVAEYTHAKSEWHGGQSQDVDVVALGGFFLW